MHKLRKRKRLALVALLAFVVATASFAFAAANTFPDGNSYAGYGSGTVAGYQVTSVQWDLDDADPSQLDGVRFQLNQTATEVRARATDGGSGFAWVQCSYTAPWWGCSFTDSPDTLDVDGIDVAAAS